MPVAIPSNGEPVDWITRAGETGRQRDIGTNRKVEAGGEDDQREAGSHQEQRLGLSQHVEDIVRSEENVA